MTRYPKQGKNRKWTVAELKAIPTDWRGDTLADGDGLSGEVRVAADGTIAVRWKYAFRWDDKVTWFQAGTWPISSLEDIRHRRDEARKLVREGINPNAHKQAERVEAQRRVEALIRQAAERKLEEANVQDLFAEWIQHGVRRADRNAALRRSFEKDVLPLVGTTPVRAVTERQLRDLLILLVDRGVNRTAEVTCANIQQMFHWAEKRQPWRKMLADGNPAELLEIEKIVSEDYDLDAVGERKLSRPEIKELAGIFADMEFAYSNAPPGSKYGVPRPLKLSSQRAVWICLSTLSRIGETLMARTEDVDVGARIWRIPPQNTKTGVALIVHLSDFALRQFKALLAEAGCSSWLFPARDGKSHVDLKSVTKQISDRQIRFKNRSRERARRREDDTLVLANGENGDWSPHDLRRTGATMMQPLISPDIIDLCQNHVLGGGLVRRTYQQHDYAEEMKKAWIHLGSQLDDLMREAIAERERNGLPCIDSALVPSPDAETQA